VGPDVEVDAALDVDDSDTAIGQTDSGVQSTDGFSITGGRAFGCAAGPSTPTAPLASGLVLLGLFALRRRRRMLVTLVASLALVGLAGTTASAFELQQMRPAPARSVDYFGVQSARILGAGDFGVHLLFNYADDPLVVRDPSGDEIGAIVGSQGVAHLTGAVGIANRLEIGIDVPLIVLQTGGQVDPFAEADGNGSFGIGNIRLVPSLLFFDTSEEGEKTGVALGLTLDLSLPTGDNASFQGEGFGVHPVVAFDIGFRRGPRLSANLGYRVRPTSELANLEVDDGFTWGAAAALPVGAARAVQLIAEFDGEVGLLADDRASEESPIEMLLGAKGHLNNGFLMEGGFGFGLRNGQGAPDWRLLAGIGYASKGDPDRDGDGYPNRDDGCPDAAEDFDDFEDADGCPDPDNDGDGVRDVNDRCPMDAEDMDDFEDADGCPDPDNDGDGIADAEDACPNEPEDADGFEDLDGCDDVDNDGDGVLDRDDACPNDPEDVDGFADEDGCPDPDNDFDGVLDANDACPTEAEDFDGFEDEDGCPEDGTGIVELTCEAIEIRERVLFETSSDVIQERSFGLLDQVASVLRSVSYITLIEVEGHTDDRGSAEYNQELSQRRAEAVMRYMVEAGIEPHRLSAVGYGEERPIADNDTSDGRSANRRVEFRIVEQEERCR
jgi:outer membrane protein OmpA-like peptidoglycan-associated protein